MPCHVFLLQVLFTPFYPPAGHSERRVSFDMSKPAATAAVAFVTLLARLTLLPGVDAQFYQVRGDISSTCHSTDNSAPC